MNVVWTTQALTDRDNLVMFIALDNPDAAIKLDDMLTDAADSLSQFPYRCRVGRLENTREMIVASNYILVY